MILTYYFFIDYFLNQYFVKAPYYERFFWNIVLNFIVTAFSMALGLGLIGVIMKTTNLYDVSDTYYTFLLESWNNDISLAGGQAVLILYLSICITTLIIYIIIFYFIKKNLRNAGILSVKNEVRIYKLSPTNQINGFYSLGIFWLGIIPLAVEILGEGKFTIPTKELFTLTLVISIPFTYINLRGIILDPSKR